MLILTVYLKWSMWLCIETEAVSCACSDGPERTAAVGEAETDDDDPAEVVSQADLTPEPKSSIKQEQT